MAKNQDLILSLLKCDVLRIGNFKLQNGNFSPIYIDLRKIIHYPQVMKDLVAALREKQIEENLEADTVCGIPYTAIPIASIFSAFYNISMVLKRKEAKDYGTKRLVEGNFKSGDSCLLIDDVLCSGSSLIDTSEALRKEGLNVRHCVVVVNRQQGGIDNLKKVGLNLYSLFNLESIFNVYCSINEVEADLVQKVLSYLKENSQMPIHKEKNYSTLSYSERALISNNPVSKRLLQIMEEKKTNLCIAVDTNQSHEFIKIVEQLGPHICLLKTHVDIFIDFDENWIKELKKLSSLHNFLILEDRKFSDTGKTVIQQYKNGLYKIETWADFVTLHTIPGTIEALKFSHTDKRGCVLLTELKTDDALISGDGKAFEIADKHTDFVVGYVASKRHQKGKNLICMRPDINLLTSSNSFNENYRLAEEAIADGVDNIIIEIDICTAADLTASVIEYKTRSFKAYLNRISKDKLT